MFNKLFTMIVPFAMIVSPSLCYAGNSNNDDIIVTAAKTEQSLKNVGSSVTVLTKEILEKRGDRTVADSLSRVSGINLSRLRSRRLRIAERASPCPGKITLSALRIVSASDVKMGETPSFSSAKMTERMFPAS